MCNEREIKPSIYIGGLIPFDFGVLMVATTKVADSVIDIFKTRRINFALIDGWLLQAIAL